MDPKLYKSVTTGRSFTYNLYHTKATDDQKPTLLFLHGFPSSSYDWRHQVAYFTLRGYGILVPDMLGYGGTDKPVDPAAYTASLLAQDIIDVLDAEQVGRVAVIGHDWGCRVVSRLANLHADRFLGFAFLAVSYTAPNAVLSYPQILGYTAKLAGRELFGYWAFFSEDDAAKIILDNYESFWAMLLSEDQALVKDKFCPTGALKAWLLNGKADLPRGSYITDEELKTQKEIFRSSGVAAPLCWYKVVTTPSIDIKDAKDVPQEKYTITKPTFYGAAKKDLIAIPQLGKASIEKFCTNATVKEYDAGHWVLWEAKDEVNNDLADWIAGL
ncbi:Alpha/Beta hydrolase protein [Crassisporium funariophilum]|nr:Alpha/Beta hydrolase protein [Crassisporium funariophilum]